LRSPLHEGLAQKLRAFEAPVHPARVAALFGDRGNAQVTLDFGGRLEARAVFPERGEQPCSENVAGCQQVVEDLEVGDPGAHSLDLVIEARDGHQQRAKLSYQRAYEQLRRTDDSGILGQRDGAFDGRDPLLDSIVPTNAVLDEESHERIASCTARIGNARPSLEEVAEDICGFVLEQIEGLGLKGLERMAEPVGDTHAVVHELSPLLDQLLQSTHFSTLRFEPLQPVRMA
jgi:hypothetical protein